MPSSAARGRGRLGRAVLRLRRGARSHRCAAHGVARPQDTLTETPSSVPPVPWDHSRPSASQLYLAEQLWLGTRCERVGDLLSEAWLATEPQSPALAIVCTTGTDPPSAWGSEEGACDLGPGLRRSCPPDLLSFKSLLVN